MVLSSRMVTWVGSRSFRDMKYSALIGTINNASIVKPFTESEDVECVWLALCSMANCTVYNLNCMSP